MAVESDAERLEFLDTDDFAETITVAGVDIVAVFFDAYAETERVEGTAPGALCRTSDITAASNGSTVVRGGTSYTIKNIQPDGEGMSFISLEEV